MGDDQLTAREAAAELGVCTHTVYRLLRRGRLQETRTQTRTWRIPRAELERWKLVRATDPDRPRRGRTHGGRRPQKRWGPLPRYPLA